MEDYREHIREAIDLVERAIEECPASAKEEFLEMDEAAYLLNDVASEGEEDA